MVLSLYIIAGIAGVINMILWGIYGDLQVETFRLHKVFRSLFFGLFAAVFIFFVDPELSLFIVALSSISIERLLTEVFKALIRTEDQGKYRIPSDLGFNIPIVLKRVFGVVFLTTVFTLIYYLEFTLNPLIVISAAGFLVAFAGMAKDAPYEGFFLFKFFRSPIITFLIGLPFLAYYGNISSIILFLSIIGGERIISEFYKKILCGKIPGKFRDDLLLNHNWKQARKKLLPLYFLSVVAIILLIPF